MADSKVVHYNCVAKTGSKLTMSVAFFFEFFYSLKYRKKKRVRNQEWYALRAFPNLVTY
jgi:hypothetical protein